MAGKIYTALLSILAVTLVAAETGSCVFTQQEIEKDIMECLVLQPNLLLQVMGHMKDPQSMATVNFICQNPKAMVDIVLCMENKLVSCYPAVKDVVKQYLPNEERLNNAMKFMCEHKKDLLEKSCMNQGQVQEFIQCYFGKLTNTMQTLRADHDMQTAVCSVIHSEEQCIKDYHGSCSASYVDLVIQLLDILVPYCPVLVLDMKNQAAAGALSSILVRGQPLKFQSQGEVKYNVVNG